FPTLFAQLGWVYDSNLFGQNILKMEPAEERAFIGNYRKLGLVKDNKVMILDELGEANFYSWNPADNALSSTPLNEGFMKKTVSYYEVADDLYESGGLKLKTNR